MRVINVVGTIEPGKPLILRDPETGKEYDAFGRPIDETCEGCFDNALDGVTKGSLELRADGRLWHRDCWGDSTECKMQGECPDWDDGH